MVKLKKSPTHSLTNSFWVGADEMIITRSNLFDLVAVILNVIVNMIICYTEQLITFNRYV